MSSALDRLSPKEREVLGLMAELGHAKAVAAQLHISTRTVETHLSRIREKLAVETTVQAVAMHEHNANSVADMPVQPLSASIGGDGALERKAPRRSRLLRMVVALALVALVVAILSFILPLRPDPVLDELRRVTRSENAPIPNFEAIRTRLRDMGGHMSFIETFEGAEKPGKVKPGKKAGDPSDWDIDIQDQKTCNWNFAAAPDGVPGRAILLFDHDGSDSVTINRSPHEPSRIVFLEWSQRLRSPEDCLVVEIGRFLTMATYGPKSRNAGSGFTITGGGLVGDIPSGFPIPGKEHHIQVIVNAVDRESFVWIDGVLKASRVPPKKGASKWVDSFSLSSGGDTTAPKGSEMWGWSELIWPGDPG